MVDNNDRGMLSLSVVSAGDLNNKLIFSGFFVLAF